MMHMHRKAIAGVAVLATAAALSACSANTGTDGSGDAAKEPLVFQVFETPALTAAFWDDSISRSEDATGVKIEKIVTPGADRTAYAKQLQASGQFPDLLASISPQDFLEADLLVPWEKSWLEENFLLPDATNIDGEAYIPPSNAQILPLVFYNKTIFADNDIQPPTDYDEFVAAIEKLRAAGITPLEFAGAEPWSASMPITALASVDVLGQDPDWISKRYAGDVSFTDPLFADAMQKAVDLVEMGAYDPGALSVDFATANQNFLDGKSAMYPMGSWFTGAGYVTAEQAENIGVFPWPSDDGSVVLPFVVGGTMSVSSNASNVEDAVAFGKAWTLDPLNMKILMETDGAFPMFKNTKFEDYDATVSSLFTDAYALVGADNTKVSSIGWVANDDALAPGINDSFYALAQSFFSNSDVHGQLEQLDSAWDAAAPR